MLSDVDAYLLRVSERLDEVFGADLLGVYLIGSLALGGYVPGRSDIDVTVVVDGAHERSRMVAVVDSLAHPALPCPAPKLELVVYPSAALRGPRPSLDWSANLNTGPAIGVEVSYDPETEPRHWFVLDVAIARQHARALVGIAPSIAFPPLDRERVIGALLRSLDWHGEHDEWGIDGVLNACRALRFVEAGAWSSKDDAAAWCRAAGPDPELVARTEKARACGADDRLDDGRVDAFLAAVREWIVRLQHAPESRPAD